MSNPNEFEKHRRTQPLAYQTNSSYNYRSTSSNQNQSVYYTNPYSSVSTESRLPYEQRYSIPTPFEREYERPSGSPLKNKGGPDGSLYGFAYKPLVPNNPSNQASLPQTSLKSTKISKGIHLTELEIEEFSQKPTANPQYISPQNKYPNHTQKESVMAAQQPLVSLTGAPYFTSIRNSPFNKAKGKTNFFDPHIPTASSTRDDGSAQSSLYYSSESFNKFSTTSNSLQGSAMMKTPKHQHYRTPEVLLIKTSMEKTKESLTNPKILSMLVEFLDLIDIQIFQTIYFEFRNSGEQKKILKRRLAALSLQIKTKEEQHRFWNSRVNFKEKRANNPHEFTQQFVKKCEHIRDITKDLDRTFPEYDKFTTEKGKDSLLKVLVAISNKMSEVGYIQGLNSIAGVFLFYLREEESFWILLYLMEKMKMKEIFKSDFEKVSLLNYQLESFVGYYLPEITTFFHDQPISLATITTQWFITLYSYSLSLPNIVKVWNLMFLRGTPYLIQFALAIFSRYKNKILTMGIDEVGTFIKDEMRQIKDDEETLFLEATQFKVTKKLLSQLEEHYKNGRPKVNLLLNYKNKGSWQIVGPRTLSFEANQSSYSDKMSTKEAFSPSINSSTTPRASQTKGISLQKIVNTIKTDLSDTIKNIFTKKDIKDSSLPQTQTELFTVNRSSFMIDDDRPQDRSMSLKMQPTKPGMIDRENPIIKNLSISISEAPTSRRNSGYGVDTPISLQRPDFILQQEVPESHFAEPKSSTFPQKPSHSPKYKAGNFEIGRDSSAGLPFEHKPLSSMYGRPKVRPTNNSIDVSDFSTFSADKDFLRSLHYNATNKFSDTSRNQYGGPAGNTTFTGLSEETRRLYYGKSKYTPSEFKSTASYYYYQAGNDFRGTSAKKTYEDSSYSRNYQYSSDLKPKSKFENSEFQNARKAAPQHLYVDLRKYP